MRRSEYECPCCGADLIFIDGHNLIYANGQKVKDDIILCPNDECLSKDHDKERDYYNNILDRLENDYLDHMANEPSYLSRKIYWHNPYYNFFKK